MKNTNQIKDHWREQRLFTRRIIACSVIAVLLAGVVLARLTILQLIDAEYYAAQSQGNRIRVQPLPPLCPVKARRRCSLDANLVIAAFGLRRPWWCKSWRSSLSELDGERRKHQGFAGR